MKIGEKKVFSTDGIETNGHPFSKTELKTMKWIEGDLGFDDEVLYTIPSTRFLKKETGKLDFLKITNVCAERHWEKNEKTKHKLGEKILAKHISDTGPVSKIYNWTLRKKII